MAKRKRCILLVEDEALPRKVMRDQLERAGYAVMESDTCGRAEALWRGGGIDLVVLDHRLPDGLGLDLLKHMRQQGFKENVVWLSADADVFQSTSSNDQNVIAKLIKPIAFHEMLSVLPGPSIFEPEAPSAYPVAG